jgi:Protein of unknown function (DUF2855)
MGVERACLKHCRRDLATTSSLPSIQARVLAAELWNARVMQVEATDFLVDLADVNRTKTRSSHCSTTEGDVLVKVEQFAFTANNMTYALIGGATGWYWDFFPAPRGWGRIPVWGFGKVVASEINDVETGEDLFGYFPMSTHVILKPGKIRSDGLHSLLRSSYMISLRNA